MENGRADELLRLAASVEKGSEHPLGEAIWAEATNRGLTLSELSGFKAEAGYGVEAEVEGRRVDGRQSSHDGVAWLFVERDSNPK